MPVSTSTHRGYALPGALIADRRLQDVQAVKAALISIDAEMEDLDNNTIKTSDRGVANGVATLNGSGVIASAQLPSYVDDIIEGATLAAFPGTGEAGKIYLALNTNKAYRWTGTVYLEILASPGSTDSVTEGSVNLYFTNLRAAAAAPVQSVAGKTGAVALIPTDITNCGTNTILQNIQSASYTLVAGDSGRHILHPSADTTARTYTIPANSSVAYDIGTALTFVNQNSAGVLTIAITTDTMRLAGAGTTGSRTLAANGVATALKLTATEWIVSGTNLT